MNADATWFWTALISGGGLMGSGWYLVRGSRGAHAESTGGAATFADVRPWRRLGAALCALLSVMFFVGVNWLDPRRAPVFYLLFWIVILILVLWICALALIDLVRTSCVHAALRGQGSAGTNGLSPEDRPRGGRGT